MSDRDTRLINDLREALLNKDPQTVEAVCFRFPRFDDGARAAESLLAREMPDDVVRWWLGEECDLPDDPESLADEPLLLLARVNFEREKNKRDRT